MRAQAGIFRTRQDRSQEDGFEIVKAVGPFAQHVEAEVDLGRSLAFENHLKTGAVRGSTLHELAGCRTLGRLDKL